jgi:HlyD family secretion protein
VTKTRIRWIVTSGLGLATAIVLAFLLWPRPLDVDVAAVRAGPISDVVADQGIARVRQSYIVSAPVGGRLERLPLEVGDVVTANTTLVACIRPVAPDFLDPRTRAQAETAVQAARGALDAAVAQRDRLEAEARRTRDQLARLQDLARQRVIAQQELDNAQADAQAAANALRAGEGEIATKRAALASAQLALTTPTSRGEMVMVRSPASGLVTHLLQQSERTVSVGTQLVEIGDTAGLEAAIEFLTQDAVKIRAGQQAEIYNWGGPADLSAEVRRVEPAGFTKVSALGVEEQRTLVILQITAPASACAGLAPGYRVWGRVYLRRLASATLAPVGVLVRNNGSWAAYRVELGRARLRPVQIGTITDRDAEILSGLAPGDQLVVYPSDQIADGVRVRTR